MLFSQDGIPPCKKMVGGLPGKRQKRRKKGRGLRTGRETGSGGRGIAAEGLNGQGIKLGRRGSLSTESAVGTKGANPRDTVIGA